MPNLKIMYIPFTTSLQLDEKLIKYFPWIKKYQLGGIQTNIAKEKQENNIHPP
jgi:hypothetical protein